MKDLAAAHPRRLSFLRSGSEDEGASIVQRGGRGQGREDDEGDWSAGESNKVSFSSLIL